MKKSSKKSDLVSIGELANLSGLRQSTIKFYTEKGILPFKQEDQGLRRHYDRTESIKRLKEIKGLKKERKTIKEIIEKLK